MLLKYNFPESFIRFFTVIYSNNSSVVQVNGHLSASFEINRGVKQGDALSCSLFVLAIDPLMRNIEANNLIEPIRIRYSENTCTSIKILGYADDIAVVTKDNGSIQEVFKEYERLHDCSGLKLNADKTEILRLSKNKENTNRTSQINYLGCSINIPTTNCVKICGNFLTLDARERYKLNVTERINSLSKILNNWSKRNLSLNGKMLIIKCHALSQLTFVNQFQNVSKTDIKKIESICYKFVWNGGPDRVKRSTLKLSKLEGGIDGIDVESFLYAVKTRQYFKAEKFCESLKFIQKYTPEKEEISYLVRTYLSRIMKMCWRNVNIDDLCSDDRITLVNQDLRIFFKPTNKIDLILRSFPKSSLNEIIKYGRSITNKVVRYLPTLFRQLLRFDLPNADTLPIVMINNKAKLMNKITSKEMQFVFKGVLSKTKPYSINSKYMSLTSGSMEDKLIWFNLWKIKNPTLRSYRLKILYKDVYSQERRHRFGISDSPNCTTCGEIETVEHQLFECANAKRMWKLYNILFSEELDFKRVVVIESNIAKELVKAMIIQLLIQIDRTNNLAINFILLRILSGLNLEYSATKNPEIKTIMHKLELLHK